MKSFSKRPPDSSPATLDGLAMTFREVLSIALGLAVIVVLGSISGDIIKHSYVNHSDITYVLLQLASDCFSCAIGGALTAVVGRSRNVISGISVKIPYPMWFWITLALLIIPSVTAGSKGGAILRTIATLPRT